ncbi:MAG: hypothetical protein RBU37_04845 [Myxococcota bacterium]|jgi:hypothetical protein|nr:hypothetical protein [Myxococcota bacterium]
MYQPKRESPEEVNARFAADVERLAALIRDVEAKRLPGLLSSVRKLWFRDAVDALLHELEGWSTEGSASDGVPPALCEVEPKGDELSASVDTLADELGNIAEQARSYGSGCTSDALWWAEEFGWTFLERVAAMRKFLLPWPLRATPKELLAEKRVEEAIEGAKLPHDWPEVAEPSFVLTAGIVHQNDRPFLVLWAGEQEISRRPTWYENGAHIITACADLRSAYRGRVRQAKIAEGTDVLMVLDDYRGYAKIKAAFRPLRRDFQRACERAKAARKVAGGEAEPLSE